MTTIVERDTFFSRNLSCERKYGGIHARTIHAKRWIVETPTDLSDSRSPRGTKLRIDELGIRLIGFDNRQRCQGHFVDNDSSCQCFLGHVLCLCDEDCWSSRRDDSGYLEGGHGTRKNDPDKSSTWIPKRDAMTSCVV